MLQFHLSYNNGEERLQLPVNPERISVTTTRGYEDIEVTQLGEYTVIGNAKLREFSFSSFFPREYNPSYCEYAGFLPPWEIVRKIERWMNTGRPIRFTLTGQIYDESFFAVINEAVTIRSFNYYEVAGSPGDIYFDMSMKEYVFIEFRRLKQTTDASGDIEVTQDALRPDTSAKVANYTVVNGDSLFKIAARSSVYDNGDKWRDIYDANKSLIGPNPNSISTGMVLVIP
ncbi:LysM peptidoglycan-binding domain-containing protein [Paenibacillus planticolens]|nr:LysM peptidoglycan-binding domain-containing protein [Paenibacillus planticolens]